MTEPPGAEPAEPNGAGPIPGEPSLAARCQAPEGVSTSPRSVQAVVDLVNALPRPVTVDCFLEALERPLELYATSGVFSAQPAMGRRSPRIFLFLDPLILSVAPEGAGRELLEMGELRSSTRSLKAEIAFPIQGELGPEAPFERLLFDAELTNCAFCHAAEEPAGDITFTSAFVSNALRPIPSEKVTVEELRAEHQGCVPEAEPERCSMLAALFDGGDVVARDFPAEMATFY